MQAKVCEFLISSSQLIGVSAQHALSLANTCLQKLLCFTRFFVLLPSPIYPQLPPCCYLVGHSSAVFVRWHIQTNTNLMQRKEEARIAKERKELAWRRDHAYDDVMTEENLEENSNQNRDENFLDDFM